MTRKVDPNRCAVCGHVATEGECSRGHGAPRALHSGDPIAPGRGLAPVDLCRGTTEVVRSVFTIVLGRPFVGLLRWPIAMNAIGFAALVAVFWLLLLPAFEGGTNDARIPLRWAFATWLLLAPPVLALIAGPAQQPLRNAAERYMLGGAVTAPTATKARLRDQGVALFAAVVLLPFGLAIAQIPWAGLPLVFVLGSATAAVVWFDTPLRQRGYAPRERAELLWGNRWRAFGIGAGLQLLAGVPFANILLLPSVAAVATTSAFVRFDKRAMGSGGEAQ